MNLLLRLLPPHAARIAAALIALLVASGCTGTFTASVPTIYLVTVEAPNAAPRVALIAFRSDQTGRRVELLQANAFSFPAGTTVVATDVLDREGRQELWVLSASRTDPRATTLHRLELQGIPDVVGASVRELGTLPLTDASGRWLAPLSAVTAVPSGCLSDLVVNGSGSEVLLVDAGSGRRCGTFSDGVDPRVHRLTVATSSISERVPFPLPPGARPGSDGGSVLLVQRPTVGGDVEVRSDGFAPIADAGSARVANLLDVRATRDGFAALASSGGDNRKVELVNLADDARSERPALARADRLWLREDNRGLTLVSVAGSQLGVTYPGQESIRQLSFAVRDITIDANAYALAVGDAGACFIDLLVASESRGCDLSIPREVSDELRFARFAAWTYAEVQTP